MRHIFTLLFALWLIPAAAVSADKEAVTYQKKDSVTVCRLLAASRQLPRGTNLQLFFARKFLGLPYVAHTLEINDDERLVVNTRQLDCTTLVENVTALTLCAALPQWQDHRLYQPHPLLHGVDHGQHQGGHRHGDTVAQSAVLGRPAGQCQFHEQPSQELQGPAQPS